MDTSFQSSVQQLEAILTSPKNSYLFISTHGKNHEILPCLIQILVEPSYESNASLRAQAAIIIRNALDSWYRKLSPNQISTQAKVELGQTLVEKVLATGERDSVVRKQVSLCIGKIGKSNLDLNLSNLFNDLNLHIRNVLSTPSWSNDPNNYYILNGCLGGFYQIIQNMISNRSSRGQLLLREVASTHFAHIHDVYSSALSTWTNVLAQQTTLNLSSVFHTQPVIELSRVCLKILSQLSIYAWRAPHQEELPTSFIRECVTQWLNVLHIRKQLVELILLHKAVLQNQSSANSIESFFKILNKHIFKFGKLLIAILNQDNNYLDFSDFSNFLKQAVWHIIEQGSAHLESLNEICFGCLALYPERIIIQSLRIMSLVMISRPNTDTLTSSQSSQLATMILKKLLVLPAHSLEFWAEDSESYDNEETNLMDNMKFDVRSCAANLLSGLLVTFPQEIITVIFSLYPAMLSQASNDLPTLLQHESIFFGIGLAASKLAAAPSSAFSLHDWIQNKFMPVLCQTDPSGRVIRRRIAWVLGQFAKEDLGTETQRGIYIAIDCLLKNSNNDVATKLAACRSLKATTNWEASSPENDLISPHLEDYIKHISQLFSDVENLDSQKVLTETLRMVIEKADFNIKPYAAQLATMMANLWQQVSESSSKSNSGNHLHNAILVTMSALAEALGPTSHEFHPMIVVFIEHSINPNNPSSVYLQEDGLILWLTIVRQAEAITPSLRTLLFHLTALIPDASDSLDILLKILQSYLILDAAFVLDSIGLMLSGIFSELMSMKIGLPPTKAILKSIECVIKCADPTRWQRWFEQSDCFWKLIQRSTATDEQVVFTVKHILTVCLIITTNAENFLSLVGFLNQKGISPTDVLSELCQACQDKIDNVSTAQERKLIASALACLVSNPNPIVMTNLETFVSIWSGVLAEGDEILDTSTNTYRYVHEYEEVDEHDFVKAGLEEKRLSQLRSQNPVKCKTLDQIISEQINCGGEELLTALKRIDSVILNELQQRLSGSLKG